MHTAESRRLEECRLRTKHWRRWGPYVSERAWGTVREDYSPDGTAWDYFPHDHARSRAYRWNEDGLAGICDRHQRICFALALWNGRDPILKERLFGLTGNEGNHGEDVKEYYFYLDCTPTHSYMRFLYKYPQAPFPTRSWSTRTGAAARAAREFELIDTGVFDDDRYFDVFVEYAKADAEDILIRDPASPTAARRRRRLHLLPTVWFRNTWSWNGASRRSRVAARRPARRRLIALDEPTLRRSAGCTAKRGAASCCSPRTNQHARACSAYAERSPTPRTPSIASSSTARQRRGESRARPAPRPPPTTALTVAAGGDRRRSGCASPTGRRTPASRSAPASTRVFDGAQREADEFYAHVMPADAVGRRSAAWRGRRSPACSGRSSSTTTSCSDWLEGDPAQPPPPRRAPARPQPRVDAPVQRRRHLDAGQVGVPVVRRVGPGVPLRAAGAGRLRTSPRTSCSLLLREWYMHPNGQLPAYEWAFGDVNPPVHAWAALARLQDRAEAARHGRSRRSSSASSRSCCSTSPGGSTARTPRA